MSFGTGRNTAYGPDSGPPPPRPGLGFGLGHPHGAYPAMYPHQQAYWQSYRPPFFMPAQGGFTTNSANPTMFAATGQGPAGEPVLNSSFPAANMTNSTGGVGCEPGYNLFFQPEHTKIHVFMTEGTAPWQLPANFSAPFHACHVPTNTTLGTLMKGFGATNPDPMMNKIIEVHEGGNGRWYKGMSFRGDDKEAMAKAIKEVGWDSSRNGQAGGKPVVWLYVVKG